MEANTVELIIKAVTSFYKELQTDEYGRYRSWEHCYKYFHDARKKASPDCDYLSLQLAFYLASWGMYRGSSFLLQKDYRVHIPIVEKLLEPKYDCLLGIDCVNFKKKQVQEMLEELNEFLSNKYSSIRKSVKKNSQKQSMEESNSKINETKSDKKNIVSSTLITKVLMGTLGCVPAYDRYFVEGIKDQNVSTGNYNLDSILKLVDFYEKNETEFEEVRRNLKVCDLQYPQMKFLDMGFWKISYDKATQDT